MSTDKVELVETQAIALSLKRLRDGAKNGYDTERWKRALYHALTMTYTDRAMTKAIREALELP
jgi:hypothetical protein